VAEVAVTASRKPPRGPELAACFQGAPFQRKIRVRLAAPTAQALVADVATTSDSLPPTESGLRTRGSCVAVGFNTDASHDGARGKRSAWRYVMGGWLRADDAGLPCMGSAGWAVRHAAHWIPGSPFARQEHPWTAASAVPC
jgi:hypothetical protein